MWFFFLSHTYDGNIGGDFLNHSKDLAEAFEIEYVEPVYLTEMAEMSRIAQLKQDLLMILDGDDG